MEDWSPGETFIGVEWNACGGLGKRDRSGTRWILPTGDGVCFGIEKRQTGEVERRQRPPLSSTLHGGLSADGES